MSTPTQTKRTRWTWSWRRKLPRSAVLLFLVAGIAAVAAFGLARDWARRIEATRPDPGAPTSVVIAAQDLPRGEVATADLLVTDTRPEIAVPVGALASADEAVGRVVTGAVRAGEILTDARLGADGAGALAGLVPPGLRALAVPAAAPPGAAPGDVVDVLAAFPQGQPHVELAAESLEILRIQAGGGGTPGVEGTQSLATVVLLVSPEEAQRLAYAAAFARLSLAVVGPETPAPSAAPNLTPSPTPSSSAPGAAAPESPSAAPVP